MKIIVVNRTKNLLPELPQACVVKLIDNPLEIVAGKGLEEKLIAQRSSEKAAVNEMVRRISGDKYALEAYKYFVEVESDLPQSLVVKIACIGTNGAITDPLVTLEKGTLFAYRDGVKITVQGVSLITLQDVQRLKDMLEMARFIGYEMP